MELAFKYFLLTKKTNLTNIIYDLLKLHLPKPKIIHSKNGKDYISFNVDGKLIRLYITDTYEVKLIEEKESIITEYYINLFNDQVESISMYRKEDSLEIINEERFYNIDDDNELRLTYLEKKFSIFSYDKLKEIYSLKNPDFEFSRMTKFLNTFKNIEEDALVADVKSDFNDYSLYFDNKYMGTIDEDIYIQHNDEVKKFIYDKNIKTYKLTSHIIKNK